MSIHVGFFQGKSTDVPKKPKFITESWQITSMSRGPPLSREMGLMRDVGIIEFKGSYIKSNDVLDLEKSIR
jgi:hypothetical protein